MKDNNIVLFFKVIKWAIKTILVIFGVIPLQSCSSGYHEENGKVTFNGKEITDKSFKVLSKEFAKDSTAAYYKERAFEYADVPTFQAVDEHYAKDTNKVYYCDEYREGQNYYMTKKQTIMELENVIPASFVSLDNGYGKDAQHAFFCGKRFAVKDIASFKSLDINFSKDNIQAYLNCIPVKESDGKTFEITDHSFAKDSKHVYYYAFDGDGKYNICILPCDVKTFKIIDYRFSKDTNKVFFLGFTLKDADAATFEVLNAGYSKDKNAVYFHEKKIPAVDPLTFNVYQENDSFNQDVHYAKDNTSVYVNDKRITGADVVSFKLMGENYGRDSKHVFYKTNLVKDANPASFNVYPHGVGDADAEDGKTKFHEGIKVRD